MRDFKETISAIFFLLFIIALIAAGMFYEIVKCAAYWEIASGGLR